MQKKLVKNFMYQASYQVLLIILPIVTIPIVSNALGPSGIGTFNYINSIVSYFILVAGLGMANYGVREISMVRQDRKKLSKKFWELELFNLFFSVGTLLVYVIFSLFTTQKIYYLVSGLSVFSCLFDITWFYSGIENFKKITIRNFLVKITSFILIIVLIKDIGDLLLYILISSGSVLISQASLWISIHEYVDWIKVSLRDCFSHFKPALSFFVAKIAITIYQNTTKTILGLMTTMTVVGYYSNAFSLVLMSGNIVNAMNTVLVPRMSNMFGNNDERGMIHLLQKTIHFQLYFTVAIMFGIIALSDKLVGWFFGPEFLMIKNIIPWLAPVIVFQSFQMAVATQYLIPKKELREYNVSIFIGAIITVMLSILLIPFIGIYGAVVGINIGYIVVSILRLNVLQKETDFVFEYLEVLKFIFSGFVMWGTIYLLTSKMNSSIFTTVIQIVIGSLVYLCLTALLKSNPLNELFFKKKK